MRKAQRYRYEMFVRVRDFGKTNSDVFPESSTGGQAFAEVSAAVAAMERHLTDRDLARVEARRVKATTRAAVESYMQTLARTARRATRDESVPSPFVLPAQKTMEALLSKARLFIEEAKPREAKFVALGLPATFISDFTTLVDTLQSALESKHSGRALKKKAETGIDHAIDQGFDAIRTLDVVVLNALRDDPVRLGHWRGARRLEGGRSSSPKPVTVAPASSTPLVPAASEPAMGVPVPVGETLRRAS